jgi:hypothetical protein
MFPQVGTEKLDVRQFDLDQGNMFAAALVVVEKHARALGDVADGRLGEVDLDFVAYRNVCEGLHIKGVIGLLLHVRSDIAPRFPSLDMIPCKVCDMKLLFLSWIHPADIYDTPHTLLLEMRDRHYRKSVDDGIQTSLLLVPEEVALESVVPRFNIVVCINRRVGYLLSITEHPGLLSP